MAMIYAFSGQGLQNEKMFDFLKSNDQGVQFLLEASKLIGVDLQNKLDIQKYLFEQKFAQLFITIMSKGIFEQLVIKPGSGVCGYSLGEVIAFICSAKLSLAEAMELVEMRATLMLEAINNQEDMYTMLSVKDGIDIATIQEQAKAAGCEVAIVLSDSHAVVAGEIEHIKEFSQTIKQLGAKFVTPIHVNVPSHTPFLRDSEPRFRKYLQKFEKSNLIYPLFDALSLNKNYRVMDVLDNLSKELSHTLQFGKLAECIFEYGYNKVLEVGPGSALKSIFSSHNKYDVCLSCNDFSTIKGMSTL